MKRNLLTLFACALFTAGLFAQAGAVSPTRFAAAIEAFEQQDQTAPPPRNSILFIGSSIFRQWKNLKEQMAPLPVFNRAFGGSRTADVLYYMDRVVLPYAPKLIVYYCGSNDVNAGLGPEGIAKGFFDFVERLHARNPRTRVLYVSILRAPQKMDSWDKVDEANRLVREYCVRDKRLGFVDANPAVFDGEGKPRMDLYLADQLHYKEPAYDGFTAILKPEVERIWRELK